MRVKRVLEPDERIQDLVYDLCRAVWHLKDWLECWAKARQRPREMVWEHAKTCRDLLIARDLITSKKHGDVQNKSGVYPYINLVEFNTSNSGIVEYWTRGDLKETTTVVSEPNAVPLRIPVLKGDGRWLTHSGSDVQSPELGNAPYLLLNGLLHWLPMFDELAVLHDCSSNPEARTLYDVLEPIPKPLGVPM